MIDPMSLQNKPRSVDIFDNVIDIDEKWFCMTKRAKNYYLLPLEEEP